MEQLLPVYMSKYSLYRLKKIQEQIGLWVDEYVSTDIIPAIMFTADGRVMIIHSTGESELINLNGVEENG